MNYHKQVDDYIASFDGETKQRLATVRTIIHECAPKAEEGFAYKMPSYKLDGKPLVYFAGYEHHIGFYATPNGHEAFQNEFALYKQGKGSVQFPHDKPLPTKLIKDVVRFRLGVITGTKS